MPNLGAAVVSLPADPSRESFDRAAEELVAAGLSTHDARQLTADRHGFSNWAALQGYLIAVDLYRRDNDPHIVTESIPDEFCRLACLTYDDDPPERRAAARELLGVHPDLTVDHIWAAAAAADVDAVRGLLESDPALADRDGGPYGWKPLHYLTYARHDPAVDEERVLITALALIAAGADPNAGYLWRGMATPFTVLTGVFGEGEQGPGRCPRHPHEIALAQLLLDAGADPNDGQALYNRMFRPDDTHLHQLFAHGLGTGDGGAWKERLAEAAPTPRELVTSQLDWAVTHGYSSRVRLLLAHGADPLRTLRDGRTVAEVAAANGDRTMLALLVASGADIPALDHFPAFVAACLAADERAVEVARADEPTILGEVLAAHPHLIARAVDTGRIDAIDFLVGLGFDVDARRDGETALHRAAWNGDILAACVLLDAGADLQARDEAFDATPLDYAEQAGQHEFIELVVGRLQQQR